MSNGKVTLAELRREAKRVGAGELIVYEQKHDMPDLRWHACTGVVDVCGDSESYVRRTLHMILRALPDGALKEG